LKFDYYLDNKIHFNQNSDKETNCDFIFKGL